MASGFTCPDILFPRDAFGTSNSLLVFLLRVRLIDPQISSSDCRWRMCAILTLGICKQNMHLGFLQSNDFGSPRKIAFMLNGKIPHCDFADHVIMNRL